MKTIAVIYESRSGHVEAMAKAVARGVEAAGAQCYLAPVAEADYARVTKAEGLIVGSFTSYGQMAGGMKAFFDNSPFGSWKGKAGGAFASSGQLGGGNETTVLSLLSALLIHGMRVEGDADGPHFGPLCVGEPDEETLGHCKRLGERVARLASA
jgi:NAD(P)H dehydrogenase (quinone)